MARVVDGDPTIVDTLFMGEVHPGTQRFLQQEIQTPSQAIDQSSQSFFEKSFDLFNRLAESRSARKIKAARRAIGSIWQDDGIRKLVTIAQLQWATLDMQRWIMAEPQVRQMYHDQRVEGYEGSYVDVAPNDIGETHYDYRRAMSGLLFMNNNEGKDEPEWSATTYYDELNDDESPLELMEQSDILTTWESLRHHLDQGDDDPTSRFNASL